MPTRTISNAGGNWNATGAWVEGAVPTSADDVVATATSGNLTLNVAGACRSIDFTSYVGTFTHSSGNTLSIGTSSAGPGNVALKLVAGMTYTRSSSISSALSFVSTVTGNTVTFAGKSVSNINFTGVGGAWTLQDTLTSTNFITHTGGTLDTNGQAVTAPLFSSTGGGTRTLTLGASTITISVGSGLSGWQVTSSGLTLNPGTSTIVMTGSTTGFDGGGMTYNNLSLTGTGVQTINNANTFNNLTRTTGAVKTDELSLSANQTVTGTLTLTGNSVTNRLFVRSDSIGTQRTATAAAISITNVDFQDILGAGAAAPFTGSSLGDCQGNSSITFPGSATRYWVGGDGSWSDSAHWSASSGGAGGASVPLPQDDVLINSSSASSGANSLGMNMPRLCRNLTVTPPGGGTFNIDTTGGTTFPAITGNLDVSAMGTSSFNPDITLWGRGAQTVRGSSTTFTSGLSIEAPGGTYTATTALICTGGDISIKAGTFDVGTVDVTCASFDLNPSSPITGRIFNMNSRTLTVTGTSTVFDGAVASPPGTLNAGTSKLVVSNTSGTSKTITLSGGNTLYNFENINAGTGQIRFQGGFYHNIVISGGTRTVVINTSGAISVSNLFQVQSTSGAIITLSLTDSITVGGTWDVDGQAGALGILQSANSSQQTINMPAGVIASSYLSISNSIAVSPTYETTMPSIRTHTAATTLGTQSWPGQVPVSAVQGDLLIALVENAQNVSINTPSGWSERHDVSVPNSAGQARFAVYARTCRSTDPSTSFNWTPSTAVNQNVRVYIFAIQNAYQGVLSAMNTQSSSSAVQTWTGSQVTTTVTSTILDFLFARYSDNGALVLEVTMPTGATKYLEDNLGAGDAGGDYVNTVLQRTQSSPGTPTAVASYGRAVTKTGWFAALQVSVAPRVKVYAGTTSTDGGNNIGWRFDDVVDVTITITTPNDGSTQSNSVIVEATVTGGIGDEVGSVQFLVDGVAIDDPVTSITNVYTKTIDISTYLDGNHEITVEANPS